MVLVSKIDPILLDVPPDTEITCIAEITSGLYVSITSTIRPQD